MGTMASQIINLAIVYSLVHLCADQGKHQSSAPLAFVWGIHPWPWWEIRVKNSKWETNINTVKVMEWLVICKGGGSHLGFFFTRRKLSNCNNMYSIIFVMVKNMGIEPEVTATTTSILFWNNGLNHASFVGQIFSWLQQNIRKFHIWKCYQARRRYLNQSCSLTYICMAWSLWVKQ